MVLEDLKALSFEAGSKQARKTAVVQAAAGERDLLNAGGGAGENCGAHEGRSNAGMKTGCDARLGDAGAQVLRQLTPKRRGGDLAGSRADPISAEQFKRIAGIEPGSSGSSAAKPSSSIAAWAS